MTQGDDREHLEEELMRARAELVRVRSELDRLRARRLVRVALRVARWARPLVELARGFERTGRSRVAPAPVPVPQVLDRGKVERRADVVVCVHNALDDVERCLDSVIAHTDLGVHRLIVVDDGSETTTAAAMKEFSARHETTLLRHEQAAGYTVAAAAGLSAGDAPFAVLLNSDTIVTPEWLDRMLDVATRDNRVAVVGPWSNAASWQSIPELTEADGSWKVNRLHAGETPADVAAAISTPDALRPEVALVNGFCYMLRRSAYEAVGGLDTERFPRGYGEEDDLSLRLRAEGYRLAIADDVYVHHAKSKSFTPEGRASIVEVSKQILREKHGLEAIRAATRALQEEPSLVRARTAASLRLQDARRAQLPSPRLGDAPRIAWVQPHLEEVGGIRRAIEMTNRLAAWGADPVLVTPEGRRSSWLPIEAQVASVTEARRRRFDVVVVSDPDVIDYALDLETARLVTYHLATYMHYRPPDELLRRFYDADAMQLANSRWTAAAVEEHTGRPVAGVVPGAIDPQLFHPVRTPRTHDVVCYGSSRAHKGTDTIVQATRGMSLLKVADLHLPQRRLATGLCSGGVFVSGAWHEGFNLPPLEAMACGIPVVMTDDGGSRDYAVDGENALVVPVKDPRAMRRAIQRVRHDEALRARLIDTGLRTAFRYRWDDVTSAFVDVVLGGERSPRPPGSVALQCE